MMEQPHFKGITPAPADLQLSEKVPIAIKTLKLYEEIAIQHDPQNGYYGCFSGGKDSVVVKRLAQMAGVRIKWHYSVTTVDPPELVRFIKREHQDVEWRRPAHHMWTETHYRGLPNRVFRWCCKEYKENGGAGMVKATGIRAAESAARAKRWSVFAPWKNGKGGWMCNPILHWTDADVWAFIRTEQVPYCSLYDEGWERLGCIGCPMNRRREEQFKRWPGYARGWRTAAHRAWKAMADRRSTAKHLHAFANADEWFDWWVSNQPMPADDDCQMGLF